jgi:hypothetical protein
MSLTTYQLKSPEEKFDALVEMGKFTSAFMLELQESVDVDELEDTAMRFYHFVETSHAFDAAVSGMDTGLRNESDYMQAIEQISKGLRRSNDNIAVTASLYEGDVKDLLPQDANFAELRDTAKAVNMPFILNLMPPVAIDQTLMDEFNELACVTKFINRLLAKHNPVLSFKGQEFTKHMDGRARAQYDGLSVPFADVSASITFDIKPDYVPDNEQDMKEMIASMRWELNASNNILNYDFNEFGIQGYLDAAANDPDREAVAKVVEKENLPNILRLVR